LPIGALMVNAASVLGIAFVARRIAGLPLVLVSLVVTLLFTHALGADFLRDPWNPFLPVSPLLLLLFLCWALATGDLWMLPWALGVGSFAVQSHVGFFTPVFGLIAVGLVGAFFSIRRRRRGDDGTAPRLGRVLLVSALVFLVLWSLPLYGEIVEQNGNLSDVANWLSDKPAGPGLDTGIRIMALQWGPRPEWIVGARDPGLNGAGLLEENLWTPLVGVLAIAGLVLAWRRRDRDDRWLGALALVGTVAGVVAAANVVGLPYFYLFRWTWAIGAAIGLFVLWTAWLLVADSRRDGLARGLGVAAIVGIVVLVLAMTIDAVDAGTPYGGDQRVIHAIVPPVLRAVPPGGAPVLVQTSGGGLFGASIVLALEKRGDDVKIEPSQRIYYSKGRVDQGKARYKAYLKVVSFTGAARAVKPSEGRLIAHYIRYLTASQKAELKHATDQALRHTKSAKQKRDLIRFRRHGLDQPADDVAVFLMNPPR
jgi:hypothetical protein